MGFAVKAFAGPPVRGHRRRRVAAYVPDSLQELDLDLPAAVLGEVAAAERAIVDLNTDRDILPGLQAVSGFLLRAETVAWAATADSAHDDPDSTPEGDDLSGVLDALEVLSRDPLTLDALLDAHYCLMRRTTRADIGGRVRSIQNWLGTDASNVHSAAFVPPPPEYLPALLEDLVAFANTREYSPLLQAALVHAQLETIHPFHDGNGRLGRMLLRAVLRRKQLAPYFVPPIALVLARRLPEYLDALRATRYVGSARSQAAQDGLAKLIRCIAAAALEAVVQARAFAARANALAEVADQAVPPPPLLTVDATVDLTGVSGQQLSARMQDVVRAGLISLALATGDHSVH